jgi:hypothetical protein
MASEWVHGVPIDKVGLSELGQQEGHWGSWLATELMTELLMPAGDPLAAAPAVNLLCLTTHVLYPTYPITVVAAGK